MADKEKDKGTVAPVTELDGPPPAWATTILQKYNDAIAHGYILYGPGVTDYGHNFNTTVIQVVEKVFEKFQMVVKWNPAEGFTFSPRHSGRAENTFKTELNIEASDKRPLSEQLIQFLDPVKALHRMTPILRKGAPNQPFCCFVIDMAEFIAPDSDLAQMRETDRRVLAMLEKWGQDPYIAQSGNIILLMVKNQGDIHSRLRAASAKYESIELPIPTYEDRLDYIRWFQNGTDARKYGDGLTNESFAQHTAGLTRKGIEDILFKVPESGEVIISMVQERKYEIIRSEFGDVVRIVEPRGGFKELVGGYEHLQKVFDKRIIQPLRTTGKSDWGGVILAGPPGTGKTLMAEAMSYESGVNCLVLSLDKILSKWVGESDRNLAKVLSLIKAMVPCIVIVDELDVALPNRQGGDNDSGVSNRILAALMPFMADPRHRGKVVWVGATNHLDNVDAALKRPGRFDRTIPVLPPDEDDRASILKVLLKATGQSASDAQVKAAAAETLTGGWTGAELLMLVGKANELAKDDKQPVGEVLEKAAGLMIPSTKMVAYMTSVAILECNDKSLLPPKLQAEYSREQQEAKVKELEPVMRRQRRDN